MQSTETGPLCSCFACWRSATSTICMRPFIHLSLCGQCFLVNWNSKAVNLSISLRRLHSAGFHWGRLVMWTTSGGKGETSGPLSLQEAQKEFRWWQTYETFIQSLIPHHSAATHALLVSPACCCRSRARHSWLWCKHQACFFYRSLHPSWWCPPGTNGLHSDTPKVHRCPPEKESSYFTSGWLQTEPDAQRVYVHLTRTANLTGVFASAQVSSAEHVLGDRTVIDSRAVARLFTNDVHCDLH